MATDRQIRILHYLTHHGSLEVQQLSELLLVSPSTVRRELKVMEVNGLLRRSHGMASLSMPIRYEIPFEKRAAQQVLAKRQIATLAKSLIRPGQVVGLSGGTTTTELARQLRTVKDITVVTNALNIALELKGPFDRRVLVTGGVMNQDSYDLVGETAVRSLRNVHLDIAFQGVSGIDTDFGFSVADEPDAAVARTMKAGTDQLIIVADHTKIGQKRLARFCPLSDADACITDSGITMQQCEILEAHGLTVLIAEKSQG